MRLPPPDNRIKPQGWKSRLNSILVVDDHPEARSWLVDISLRAFRGASVIAAATLAQARERMRGTHLDLALVDLGLPDGNGSSLVTELARRSPETFLVVTTIFDDDHHLFTALAAGAGGYLLKDEPEDQIIERLQGILRGNPPLAPGIARRILRHFQDQAMQPLARRPTIGKGALLSDRETEVLALLAKGLNRTDVARVLNISPNTAAGHVKAIYRKLNVSGRAEATLEAVNLGIVDPPA
jgi:DNA-binding NarL/FixJ family response regulator